jgi:hypothetical protein
VVDAMICEAIRGRRLMMYEYGGLIRVVEPHLLGETEAGHKLLSGWLRPGYSRSDPNGGWRTWRVERIGSAQLIDQQFDGPRPGYNPADRRLARIHCALSAAALVAGGGPESAPGAPAPDDTAPDDTPPDAVEPPGGS